MKRINILLLVLLSSRFLPAQITFNTVIATDQFYVDGIYQPLIELEHDELMALYPAVFRSQYGETTFKLFLNKQGKILRNERLSDTLHYIFTSDCIVQNNLIYCCGQTFSYIDSIYELWYGKLSLEGNFIWEKSIRTNFDRPHFKNTISLSNQNLAYCGANSKVDPNSIGGATLAAHGLVVISDTLGNMLKYIEVDDLDTNTLEIYYGITEDPIGNIYACGILRPGSINNDGVIVKINSDGKLVWRKRIKTAEYSEVFVNILFQKNNSLLVIGDSYNGDFFGDKFFYTALYNFDLDGNIQWEKRILKYYHGEVRNCVEDIYGDIVCAGTVRISDTDYYNGYICKFSNTGDSIWSRVIDNHPSLTEQFFNISQASDGGYYLTGYSWVEGNNSSKSWIVKVDSVGCLVPGCHKVVDTKDVSNGREKAFVLYPNPAASTVYIHARTGSGMDMELRIYDLLGTLVQRKVFIAHSVHQYQLDLDASIPNGQYLIAFYNRTGALLQQDVLEIMR